MDQDRSIAQTSFLSKEYFRREAKTRWLRPGEICEILKDSNKYTLTVDPPQRPPSGSLIFFNRRALRYYRNDGHDWRKKKNGKTVREAHEKLKCGNVEVLHCYYAHGEFNSSFQRRIYWLLDKELDNIVCVHYRDLGEGSSIFPNTDPITLSEGALTNSFAISTQLRSDFASQTPSNVSTPSIEDSQEKTLSEFEDADYWNVGTNSIVESLSFTSSGNDRAQYSTPSLDQAFDSVTLRQMRRNLANNRNVRERLQIPSVSDGADFRSHSSLPSKFPENFGSNLEIDGMREHAISSEQPNCHDGLGVRETNPLLNNHAEFNIPDPGEYDISPNGYSPRILGEDKENSENVGYEDNYPSGRHMIDNILSSNTVNAMEKENHLHVNGELNEYYKSGRWMGKECSLDCDDSLMNYGGHWNDIETESYNLNDHVGPSLQDQYFSIIDFSPEWAFHRVETKVLISGKFLGGIDPAEESKWEWSCMFGETEVPAEFVPPNSLRCYAPPHAPGQVPFYITCSNRSACSEIREFEYREDISNVLKDEVHLLLRFSKLLSSGAARKRLSCGVCNCHKCNLKKNLFSMLGEDETEWDEIGNDNQSLLGYYRSPQDAFILKLLKERLYEWLVYRINENSRGLNVLDGEGQGVIHLAAALGYQWAIRAIVAAGINPNLRDAQGKSGLHWAAYYGREEAVLQLLSLEAAPGAIEDPTGEFPYGQTAADLAWSRGHKGISGYLAELDLRSHLSKLYIMENAPANVATGTVVETEQTQSSDLLDGEEGDESIVNTAVKNSALIASQIQAALTSESGCKTQLTWSTVKNSQIPDEALAVAVSSVINRDRRFSGFNDYLHNPATENTKKVSGYRGQRNFAKVQNRIERNEPHVGDHQKLKPYAKILWAVSFLEKAILRWRRKRSGLRGFRLARETSSNGQETREIDEYEFLAFGRKQKLADVGKALARVQSIANQPDAREQYIRLVKNQRKLKASQLPQINDELSRA